MNNAVATQFNNFDKLYQNVSSKGLANLADENGPLNNLVNSMVNPNIANNRFEFTKTILQRTDNPHSLGALMLDQNKYNALPDNLKGIVVDILSKLLNYKDPNNTEATIRASIDSHLLENANRINYNDINFVGSGNGLLDLKVLVESLTDISSISKPLLNDPNGATGPVFDMLVILKSSGNINAYNLALDLLNKMETYSLVKKVITKMIPLSSNIAFSSDVNNNYGSSTVAFNRNLVSSVGGNLSIDGMINTMANTLSSIINPIVQSNMPNMLSVVSYFAQSIPTLVSLDIVRTFNSLITMDPGSQITPNDKSAIEFSYGKYKAIHGNNPINHNLRISIALGYLSIKLVELIQSNTNLGQDIIAALTQYIQILDLIAYGTNASNVSPIKLELSDAIAADIQSGKPFYTLGLFGGNSLIDNAAKNLFIINPINGLPLLSPKNIIESAGTAYGNNLNQGVNFIMVRTYLEKVPQLKPYIINSAQLDELAQAITAALARLQING